ncbi:hypothetical protein ABEB22_13880 (plasmid) [Thioclava sp. 'Guangxiensis']|uniref:hypothetical protein n=1 Tax=Thioclava sp. 'Guangxiensis' TaxID=3149044 RepID=UPI0032C4511F
MDFVIRAENSVYNGQLLISKISGLPPAPALGPFCRTERIPSRKRQKNSALIIVDNPVALTRKQEFSRRHPPA